VSSRARIHLGRCQGDSGNNEHDVECTAQLETVRLMRDASGRRCGSKVSTRPVFAPWRSGASQAELR